MRVIAGRLGGRRLVSPKGNATRPTAERVREALFSALGDVSDALVCDVYAGTGALGIEALSRGARHAVFVERHPNALAALRSNLQTLGLEDLSRIIALPATNALRVLEQQGPFDLVLMDPPYAAMQEADAMVQRVSDSPLLLAKNGRLVLEHDRRHQLVEVKGILLTWSRAYGDTVVSIWTRDEG